MLIKQGFGPVFYAQILNIPFTSQIYFFLSQTVGISLLSR